MDVRLKKELCKRSNFKEVEEMGRYLGANLKFPKRRRDKYKFITERVRKRLQGWKASSLSMAGRIMLVKLVANSMAMYPMQHDRLPQGIIEELERASRNFIWGDEGENHKWDAVSWEKMCKPKEEGCLGILQLKGMNKAFLCKAWWRMQTNPKDLWVQVLEDKYGRERYLTKAPVVKGSDSRFWKELAKVWESSKNNIEIKEEVVEKRFERRQENRRTDATITWKLTKDGKFNTKSAYLHTHENQRGQRLPECKRIWKLCVPERAKVFRCSIGGYQQKKSSENGRGEVANALYVTCRLRINYMHSETVCTPHRYGGELYLNIEESPSLGDMARMDQP